MAENLRFRSWERYRIAARSKVSTEALSGQDQDMLTELLSTGSVEDLQYYLPALRGSALLKHVAIGSKLTSTSICLRYESSIVGSYRSIQTPWTN